MNARRWTTLLAGAALSLLAACAATKSDRPVKMFTPDLESLKEYRAPEWFRDAKFGIWAHWGPQAVPMVGDWYARNMYIQGHPQYEHHLKNYGHPSEHGYKDIIPLWKAEKWDPDRLMALYKKAGARYFVSMACHHDNFDLWNSMYHKWNAVQMGPKRDVVGDWQKAARKLGLRFGVSEHMGASFTWWQPSHGADKTGPKAGVPYDGADPKYQDLYHPPTAPDDKAWYSTNPAWQQEWFTRIKDLVDNYDLDLLYSDGGVAFGNDVGRKMIAHLYNTSLKQRGRADVVYTSKQKSQGMWVEDLERGVMPQINPDPWQTDTSIADWYYNKNWEYSKADWVIHSLVDIVSKNGNLLLNVVQRPDGSLDAEVEQMLEKVAAWTSLNGEAIYGTRPWVTYGESAVKGGAAGGSGGDSAFSAKDIRFTTKKGALYAIAMGWPEDRKLVIRSLAKPNAVKSVTLLGYKGKLAWTQTDTGLEVPLPAQKPCEYAFVLKILGENLQPVATSAVVSTGSDGSVALEAADAELHGALRTEEHGGKTNIGFWDEASDWVSWKTDFRQAGDYEVTIEYACANETEGSEYEIAIGDARVAGKIAATGGWDKFTTSPVGNLKVAATGPATLTVKAVRKPGQAVMNLRSVKLKPVKP